VSRRLRKVKKKTEEHRQEREGKCFSLLMTTEPVTMSSVLLFAEATDDLRPMPPLQRQGQARRQPGRADGTLPRCRNSFQFPVPTQSLPATTPANSPSLIFTDAPEASYGSNAREPWFYDFLET
jgi:hypothetical protein